MEYTKEFRREWKEWTVSERNSWMLNWVVSTYPTSPITENRTADSVIYAAVSESDRFGKGLVSLCGSLPFWCPVYAIRAYLVVWGHQYSPTIPYLVPLGRDVLRMEDFNGPGHTSEELAWLLQGPCQLSRDRAASTQYDETTNHSSMVLDNAPATASRAESIAWLLRSLLLPIGDGRSRKTGKARSRRGFVNLRDRLNIGMAVIEAVRSTSFSERKRSISR